MHFLLMKKNIEVARIFVDQTFSQSYLTDIYREDCLPLHIQYAQGQKKTIFNHWFSHRVIPKGREKIDDFMTHSNCQNQLEMAMKNRTLSLSDHYWIKKQSEVIKWEDINFFQNNYSEEIGNIIMGTYDGEIKNYYSPDIVTNGWLRKSWRRDNDGIDYLIKMGSAPYYQEPINEVFCTELMEKFCKLDFVHYKLGKINNQFCSICENFVSETEAFVPAFEIYQTASKPSYEEPYTFLVKRCECFGIKDSAEFIESMIAFDYLIHNTDRHMGNFGFMQNTDTMKFTRAAPLFDNGSCLLGGETPNLNRNKEAEKMYRNWQINQIKLIKNWDLFQFKEVREMSDRLYDLLKMMDYESEKIDQICKEYDNRWQFLVELKEKVKERRRKRLLERDESELCYVR